MAGSGLIGALRVTLGLDTAAFEAGSKRAAATAKRDAGLITKAYSAAGSQVQTAMGALTGALSIGSLVAVTSRALDYASSLQEVSQQLGITSKDLQEYRYAATQVGISQETMDKGLAKLTLSMGQARAGVEKPKAAFQELSKVLGTDILKGAATAGDAIPLIADALLKVKDPASRAALEVALFGKAGQQLDTLLAGGSAAVNELRDAAQALGLVLSDEQIQNADKTADKLSELKQVLEARIAGAVANNAQAIYGLAESFVTLSSSILDAVGAADRLRKLSVVDSGRSLSARFNADIPTMAIGFAQGKSRGQIGEEAAYSLTKGSRADRQALLTKTAQEYNSSSDPEERAYLRSRQKSILKAEADAQKAARTPPRPATQGAGAGTSDAAAASAAAKARAAREKAAREAERAAKETEKRDERYNKELGRLVDDQFHAESELSHSAAERSRYAQLRITNDQEAYKKELDAKVKTGELTATQARRLAIAQAYNTGLEHEIEEQRAADEATKESLTIRTEAMSLHADLLRGDLSEAKTQAERRTLQGQLLDIEYDRQRAALEAVLALNSSTDAEKDIAKARLAQLDTLKAHDAAGIQRDTAGPMEQFGNELHRTAGQIAEDFQQIQVDGIKTLNDGLVDAITNSKSLGDVFKAVSNQIIGDLIRIALREAESSIFGGGKSGGGVGGLISGIGSVFRTITGTHTVGGSAVSNSLFNGLSKGNGVTGLAGGGSIRIRGGPSGIDTNLMSINGMPTARLNNGETLKVEKAGAPETPAFQIIPSPWFDVRAAAAAEPSIQGMGVRAAGAGANQAQRMLSRSARQRLGRG